MPVILPPRWYHLTTHTYGVWLQGDPRGFRTRHGEEHVEGDYKNPPPAGTYDERHERNAERPVQDPVTFPRALRPAVAGWVADKLTRCGALVLCVSAGATHVHVLAKMPPGHIPRIWLGRAKKHVSFMLKPPPYNWEGKVWAVRSKVIPVNGRPHQLRTVDYIGRHVDEGAAVWDFRDHRRAGASAGTELIR